MTSAAAPAPTPSASHGNESHPLARHAWPLQLPRGKTPHTAPDCPDNLQSYCRTIHRGQNTPHPPQKNTALRLKPCHRQSPETAVASRPSESSSSASPPPSPWSRGSAATPPPPRGPVPQAPSVAPPPRLPGRPSSKTAAPPMPQTKFS